MISNISLIQNPQLAGGDDWEISKNIGLLMHGGGVEQLVQKISKIRYEIRDGNLVQPVGFNPYGYQKLSADGILLGG